QPLSDRLTLARRAPEPGFFTPFIFRVFQAFGGDLKKTPPSQGGTQNAFSLFQGVARDISSGFE
ncbi:MAG: hypothetical protein ACREA2_23780, partial [Blastocatellia bacterium]